MRARLLLVPAILLGLAACGGGSNKPDDGCQLTLDGLEGTQWAMLEAMPDQTTRINGKARMRFLREDGVMKVEYTVASLGDVYTYACQQQGECDEAEWFCAEDARVRDWCQALETHDRRSCTVERLREIGPISKSDEEIQRIIDEEALPVVAKYRNTPDWDHFVLNNNNLGNKLQGLLHIRIDERRCRLHVTDMYMTIYDGEKIEDFNPVGQNPFVQLEGDWLWEHCGNGVSILEHEEATLPEDLSQVPPPHLRSHPCHGAIDDATMACMSADTRLYYDYLGEDLVEAEDGCTYSFDAYAGWQLVASDIQAPVEDGKVRWSYDHEWGDLSLQPGVGVFSMVRYKACGGGQPELVDTVCNAAKFR